MKTFTTILMIAFMLTLLSSAQTKKTYVASGLIYGTTPAWRPEKVMGQVKEIKVRNFWATELNGKPLKGESIKEDNRPPAALGSNFSESFNSAGIPIGYQSLSSDDQVLWHFKADIEGNKIKQITRIWKDTIRWYFRPTYSENYISAIQFYLPNNDTIFFTVKYLLDKDGNRTKIQNYNKNQEPTTYTEFSYNPIGLVDKHCSCSKDGKMITEWTYTYNSNGSRATQHHINNKGEVYDYEFKDYKYDKKGNWISYTFYKDNKPYIIREREITYY